MFSTLLGKTITSCLEKLMPYEAKKKRKKENVTKMGPFAKQRQIMQRPLKDKNR